VDVTRILRRADCGNSPKNTFVEALCIGLATGTHKAVLGAVTDDIQWSMLGGGPVDGTAVVEGKAALGEALARIRSRKAVQVTIDHVLSHGKTGAVDGVIEYGDGALQRFSAICEFASAKGTAVRRVIHYFVE
jgi:hypothetical protein